MIKSKSLKIFPTSINKKCCICLEETKKYKKCSNYKCVDGIYCLECLKKMTVEQKKKCSICRQETNFIKNNEKIKILVKKNTRTNIVNKRNKNKYLPECIYILFSTISCILLSFITGVLIFYLACRECNVYLEIRTFNPFIFIIVGGIILVILICIFSLLVCILKKLKLNFKKTII